MGVLTTCSVSVVKLGRKFQEAEGLLLQLSYQVHNHCWRKKGHGVIINTISDNTTPLPHLAPACVAVLLLSDLESVSIGDGVGGPEV